MVQGKSKITVEHYLGFQKKKENYHLNFKQAN